MSNLANGMKGGKILIVVLEGKVMTLYSLVSVVIMMVKTMVVIKSGNFNPSGENKGSGKKIKG